MQPAYVSAVDSGNLAGLLLAVAQGCTRLAQDEAHGSPDRPALLQPGRALPQPVRRDGFQGPV